MGVGKAVIGSPQAEVCLVMTHEFEDARQIADKFRADIPVIANMQGCETRLATRLIDFCSGLTYALGGSLQRLDDRVFLLAPSNVELSSDGADDFLEKGFVNQV